MYEMTVKETYKKRITSIPSLNGIWSRTMRDVEEINNEVNELLEYHSRKFDVLDTSKKVSKDAIVITMEYARKRGIGRLTKTITIKKKKKAPTRVTRVDDLI